MSSDPSDIDPQETQEWLDSLNSVIRFQGSDRAQFLLQKLQAQAKHLGLSTDVGFNTPYTNTILPDEEERMPDDESIGKKLSALIRWNAVATVLHSAKSNPDVGGHIASYASAATLYDIGFNYFFNASSDHSPGDLVFFQGHSSPGIYARAFLEGRISEEQFGHFRLEVRQPGLSSYPHPWLMPNFWQFPTVSMGLGPLQAIYQARFLKYLDNRGLVKTEGRKVWAFCGDGEMDEPESTAGLSIAAREHLDNLIFVINCNLQRLDGPVRGNGHIIQELEALFRGFGWNVIKVIWGRRWDPLLETDYDGLLLKRMSEVVDGDYQAYRANDGAFIRKHFFGKYPELLKRVEHMSDDEIWRLNRGGLDPYKVYAAYAKAVKHKGQPTVILAKTVKGYGMGAAGEGQNYSHSQKKMAPEDLKAFRDRFSIPIADDKVAEAPFYRPAENSAEMQFLQRQRKNLGGYLPSRRTHADELLKIPALDYLAPHLKGTSGRDISSTMAFVRILNTLLKDTNIKERIVPIVADEARTFGMEGLFRQLGIYSSLGQLYTPVDIEQVMYYREDKKGQILQEGIDEAGSLASWIAAATSYSTNNFPMIPIYIFYSMFGFQRVGDLIWAAGDSQAHGFLIGATAGRTTLAGEGLQHQDGQSHVMASFVPNCMAYDPAFSYELAVIIQDGLERMYVKNERVFYYITTGNENYNHPDMPPGSEAGIIKGMYCFKKDSARKPMHVQLLGSGSILLEVIAAAEILNTKFNISSDVFSVTSFNELRREALEVERHNALHPLEKPKTNYVTQCLDATTPVIAATDYVKLHADQIRQFIPAKYSVLGTDGYGRSDSREALRYFFEVDRYYIVVAALNALLAEEKISAKVVADAMQEFKLDPNKPNPITV